MSEVDTARQFWIRRPGHGEIVSADLAPRQADEVEVRALYSGISRGTESRVFRGEVPTSQYQAMRAPFQEGEFPGPVKYGYASVGVVEEAPPPEREVLLGRTVFCLFPHQDRYRVPASRVVPLPVDVPPPRAVLTANLETAVNVVWDSGATVGDRIVVVGAGVVGLLIGWLCRRIPGVDISLVDVNPARAAIAHELGLPFLERAPKEPAADVVIHASGQPAGLASALEAAGDEATVVEVSWFGDQPVTVPLGEGFHSRRLTLRSSQVGHLPPARRPRWDHRRRIGLAAELLRDPRLDALISGESDFDDLPAVLAALSRDGDDTLCHRIRYAP